MSQQSSDLLMRVHDRIVAIGRWLLNSSPIFYVAMVVLIAGSKVTVMVNTNDLLEAVAPFPTPVNRLSTNVVDIMLLKALGSSSSWFLVMSFVALVAGVLLLTVMVRRFSRDESSAWRIALIFAVSWPLILADLSWMGAGGALIPTFVVLFTLGRHWLLVTVGLLGWVLTHPEQALAASLSFLVLTIVPEFARWRRRAVIAVVVAGACTLLGAVWLADAGLSSRGGFLQETAAAGFSSFLRNGMLGVYAWWGLWWLAVAALLIGIGGWKRVWLVIALVGIPGLFTVVTLDGTRVFSGVASASGVLVIAVIVRLMSQPSPSVEAERRSNSPRVHAYVGYLFLAFILFPNVQVMMPGDPIPLPGVYPLGLIENFVWPR